MEITLKKRSAADKIILVLPWRASSLRLTQWLQVPSMVLATLAVGSY